MHVSPVTSLGMSEALIVVAVWKTQVLLCNICPYRLLVQVFRGTFQQEGLVFICFSCVRDILRSTAEANAA